MAQNWRKIAAKSHYPIYVRFCAPFYAFPIFKNESHIQKWKRKMRQLDIQMYILNVAIINNDSLITPNFRFRPDGDGRGNDGLAMKKINHQFGNLREMAFKCEMSAGYEMVSALGRSRLKALVPSGMNEGSFSPWYECPKDV